MWRLRQADACYWQLLQIAGGCTGRCQRLVEAAKNMCEGGGGHSGQNHARW